MDLFPYKVSANRFPCKCGIDVYSLNDFDVVLATELDSNQGMSICNAFEDLVPQVANAYSLNIHRLLWIEHWLERKDNHDRYPESYDVVLFQIQNHHVCNPDWISFTNPNLRYFVEEHYPGFDLQALNVWVNKH